MQESTYNLWDVIIKGLGFLATAASIYFGLTQFEREQRITLDLEFKRNFWQKQNQLYADVCNEAGAIAANINDPKIFQQQKQKFLTHYYGQTVLVEDARVEKAMRELKAFLEIFETGDNQMDNQLKAKVLGLSEACKQSSQTFKLAALQ